MLLRYIGEDGSMGLRKGAVYKCGIMDQKIDGKVYICVYWTRGADYCPYSSFKKMFENWEEI